MANDKPKGFGIGNNNRPMDTQKPPTDNRTPTPWSERDAGLPGLLGKIGQNRTDAYLREQERTQQGYNWLAGTPAAASSSAGQAPMFSDGQVFDAMQAGQMDTGQTPFSSAGGQYQPTLLEQALAYGNSLQGGGGGAAAPDYSAYRASLTDQAQQINAQIQAMYNQLGESAGENVARLEDIYGGAQAGIGNIYGSAAANTADAYGSSQQQAADQLARLGIEAASCCGGPDGFVAG